MNLSYYHSINIICCHFRKIIHLFNNKKIEYVPFLQISSSICMLENMSLLEINLSYYQSIDMYFFQFLKTCLIRGNTCLWVANMIRLSADIDLSQQEVSVQTAEEPT